MKMLWTEVYEVLIGCLTHIRLGNEGILIETWCFTSQKSIWTFKNSLWFLKASSLCPWPLLDCVNCSLCLQMGQQELCRCVWGWDVSIAWAVSARTLAQGFCQSLKTKRVFLACGYNFTANVSYGLLSWYCWSFTLQWILLHHCKV